MKIPVFYSKKTSLEKNLEKFLKFAEYETFMDQTENEKIGWEYINEAKKNVDLNEIIKNVDDYGSDKLVALVTIAQEEGLTEKELLDSIYASLYIEPTTGRGGDNYIFRTPVEEDVEINLHSFKGKLDTKEYADIYEELKKLLTPEEVDHVLNYGQADIENDILYTTNPHYYWAAHIDEDKFKDILVTKLDMTSEEIEQLTKVAS